MLGKFIILQCILSFISVYAFLLYIPLYVFKLPLQVVVLVVRSKQLIKDAIMHNDFLAKLDASQVHVIVDSMHAKELKQDDYVIREGEVGQHLYVAADGQYEVIKDGVSIGRIGPGEAFGELAMLYNCTRTASVKGIVNYPFNDYFKVNSTIAA